MYADSSDNDKFAAKGVSLRAPAATVRDRAAHLHQPTPRPTPTRPVSNRRPPQADQGRRFIEAVHRGDAPPFTQKSVLPRRPQHRRSQRLERRRPPPGRIPNRTELFRKPGCAAVRATRGPVGRGPDAPAVPSGRTDPGYRDCQGTPFRQRLDYVFHLGGKQTRVATCADRDRALADPHG